MAIRSQWKDLLIGTFPSLTPGKLFTEDGKRDNSSLTTIFVTMGLPGNSALYRAQLSLISDLPWHQTGLTQTLLFPTSFKLTSWDGAAVRLVTDGSLRMDHLTFFLTIC